MCPILDQSTNLRIMPTSGHDATISHDALSETWLAVSRSERRPVNTIARRRATLRSIGNAGTATREEVEAWWLTRAHLSPGTRHNELANLRSFYR